MYNSWIEDYNKFKKHFGSDVIRYCNDQMTSGAGIVQIIHLTKCEYRSATDLADKYKILVEPMSLILFAWHNNAFPMAEIAANAIHRCGNSKSCRNPISASYKKNRTNLFAKLIKDLDEAIKTKASSHNAEWLADQKKGRRS